MAISKNAVVVLAATSVPAGTLKLSPVAGPAIDCRAYYGGELTAIVTNGSSAPGAPCTLMFQSSHDGTVWADYQGVTGDTTASSVNSQSIMLDRGVMYVRPIAYGNITNAVTVRADLQAITGL